MNHRATSRFWAAYDNLSPELRTQADKQFQLLKSDLRHPSLHFKKTGRLWSARVNRSIRALAVQDGEDYVWFWIGDHREYERPRSLARIFHAQKPNQHTPPCRAPLLIEGTSAAMN